MKKALPKIVLIAYIVALVACFASIIVGIEVSLTSLIIFPIFVIVVMTMMFFATKTAIKKKLEEYALEESALPFEGLINTDETETESDEIINSAPPVSVSEVFFEDPAEICDAEEKTEEAEKEAEAVEKVEDDPEVDVISTEGADEEDNKSESFALPVILGDDAVVCGEESDEEIPEADMVTSMFSKARYVRTYASRLIQSDDDLKSYYSTIKNTFMSYKKVTCSVSREHERVRCGRTTIGIIKIRGKMLLLYLALDPRQFEGTMYLGEDVSDTSKYSATPFLYRVNGPRKASRAARLIAMMAKKLEMAPTAIPASEDYVARFPYESTEDLVAKGLIIDVSPDSDKSPEIQ